MKISTTIYRIVTICGLAVLPVLAQDPPSRVARLNYLQGNVSMLPAGAEDWSMATQNRPFTIGDGLYTDDGARAELHLDVAVLRAGPMTNFTFENLDDQTVQLSLTAGSMYIHVRNFSPDQFFEVDTPNGAFTLLQNGLYRFDVDPNGNTTYAVVRQGQMEVTGGGQAFTLNQGNSAYVAGTDQLSYDVEMAPNPDDFDNWCSQRDYHEAHLRSFRYVSPTMIGYEDLDDNGEWAVAGQYGNIWYPRQVEAGWAPYHNGHWAWVAPWGWTWVDDASWGFAPFHYGRWAYVGNRWGWCPGPVAVTGYGGPPVRAQYAPALVAFFGGANFGVSVSIGGGGASMGWVPLGFGEVYTPPYHVSQNYFRNVNVSSTTISNTVNITNVYNTTYVNKTNITNITVVNNHYSNMSAPGAVTAMPQASFASGRAVAKNAVVMTPAQVANIRPAQAAVFAPAVAPTREALAPVAGRGPAAHPPAQIMARAVVAKRTPPPAPPSFAVQQAYVKQHPGQPINNAAIRQSAPAARPVAAVKQAPVAHAVAAVHVGQRVGNQAVLSKAPQPAGRPAAPAPVAHEAKPEPAPALKPAPAPAAKPAPAPVAHEAKPSAPAPAPKPAPVPAREAAPAAKPAAKPEPAPAAKREAPHAQPAEPAPKAAPKEAPKPVEPAPKPAAKPAPKPAEPAAKPAAKPEPTKTSTESKNKKKEEKSTKEP